VRHALSPRANWKGSLKIAALTCPVALYTATSTSDRIAFHTINRATGHRVRRTFVDGETGQPVDATDQVKGYETEKNDYVILEPDEVAAAAPQNDKTLSISSFMSCAEIDSLFLDKPYYLSPSFDHAGELFALIRDGMRKKSVVAIAEGVLFRRVRNVLIRPYGEGMIATTLHFDYEVRSIKDAFDEVPDIPVKNEMLQLAKHIIETKKGVFDPSKFEDRYEAALAEFVKAKVEGRPVQLRQKPERASVVDLMEALRKSADQLSNDKKVKAKAAGRPRSARPTKAKAASSRRKAS
jgi:DNA end-binding protein Ku